jgi:hypothetical protein
MQIERKKEKTGTGERINNGEDKEMKIIKNEETKRGKDGEKGDRADRQDDK